MSIPNEHNKLKEKAEKIIWNLEKAVHILNRIQKLAHFGRFRVHHLHHSKNVTQDGRKVITKSDQSLYKS